MKRTLALVALMGLAGPALAERTSLTEVLSRATAMTNIGQGALMVATPDGGFLCMLSIPNAWIGAAMQDQPVPEGQQAQATCVSTGDFQLHGTGAQ